MSPLLRRDRIWPAIIVTLLLGNVTLGVVLMRVASGDPHFAVEPDYYRRAVGWDSTQAQARQNLALGWQLVPALGAVGGGDPLLTLVLRDASGAPLDGASVSVEARAVAHASDVLAANLLPTGTPGTYAADLPVAREGLWEVRAVAIRGEDQLTAQLRLDARRDGPAVVVTERPGAADPERVAAGLRVE
jgi:nitrogen fixation protein FixH